MSSIQVVNLADNINAAILKINQNFAGLDSAVGNVNINIDSGDITNIVNNILDSDYFLTVINQEYLNQFTINTNVEYLDSDIQANASAIFELTSRIDITDSSVLVLAEALTQTQAEVDGLVIGAIDSDLIADAIANANSQLLSLIQANDSGITVLGQAIDSVNASLILLDSATNNRIDLQVDAVNSLISRIDADSASLSALAADVTQLGIDLQQMIDSGITITPEQVTQAIGGALDELTLRLDADSDKLVLEAQKIVDLNTALTLLDSETGELIQAEADARQSLASTVSTINGIVTAQGTSITNLSSRVDSDFATINQTLTTLVNDSDGASAVYALNLDVNNHVAGIRLENTGTVADFAITADTFKIVNASDNEIQPFTVDGTDVFLSNATVTGALDITTVDAGVGSMSMTGDVILISDAAGNPRVKLGRLIP